MIQAVLTLGHESASMDFKSDVAWNTRKTVRPQRQEKAIRGYATLLPVVGGSPDSCNGRMTPVERVGTDCPQAKAGR